MIWDKIYDDISTWAYGLIVGLIGSVIWLLRKVNTNEAQIELLKQEIALRQEAQDKNDTEIKSHLSEMRDDIKSLMLREH